MVGLLERGKGDNRSGRLISGQTAISVAASRNHVRHAEQSRFTTKLPSSAKFNSWRHSAYFLKLQGWEVAGSQSLNKHKIFAPVMAEAANEDVRVHSPVGHLQNSYITFPGYPVIAPSWRSC